MSIHAWQRGCHAPTLRDHPPRTCSRRLHHACQHHVLPASRTSDENAEKQHVAVAQCVLSKILLCPPLFLLQRLCAAGQRFQEENAHVQCHGTTFLYYVPQWHHSTRQYVGHCSSHMHHELLHVPMLYQTQHLAWGRKRPCTGTSAPMLFPDQPGEVSSFPLNAFIR